MPRYSGCSSDHQAGDEHGQDGVDQEADDADAGPAWRDLAELDVDERDHPPSGVKLSWPESTEPVEVPVVDAANTPDENDPKRTSLLSRFPPPWSAEIDWSTPRRVSSMLPFCSNRPAARRRGEPQHAHDGEHRPALALAAHHLAVGDREGEADDEQGEDLEHVRQPGRALERVGRVGVVEAAAVRAEVLDRLLAGHRAAGELLLGHRLVDRVPAGVGGLDLHRLVHGVAVVELWKFCTAPWPRGSAR